MKAIKEIVELGFGEWNLKRKMKKRMMSVLKDGYKVNFKTITKEKVHGLAWDERLVTIYLIDMSMGDFAAFHRTVLPISNNLEIKSLDWVDVLDKDGHFIFDKE
jgi:hypothetical protein